MTEANEKCVRINNFSVKQTILRTHACDLILRFEVRSLIHDRFLLRFEEILPIQVSVSFYEHLAENLSLEIMHSIFDALIIETENLALFVNSENHIVKSTAEARIKYNV